MSQERPYDEVASPDLDAAAAELAKNGKLQVSLIDDTMAPSLRVDGPCPRCEHEFSQTRALELPVSSIRRGQSATPLVDTWADFLCDCRIAHPGAPTNERGCGASYSLGCPTG